MTERFEIGYALLALIIVGAGLMIWYIWYNMPARRAARERAEFRRRAHERMARDKAEKSAVE